MPGGTEMSHAAIIPLHLASIHILYKQQYHSKKRKILIPDTTMAQVINSWGSQQYVLAASRASESKYEVESSELIQPTYKP